MSPMTSPLNHRARLSGNNMRFLWRLTKIFAIIYIFTAAIIAVFAIAQSMAEPDNIAPADFLVVLGAGMNSDGTLHESSKLRVIKAVELFQAGAAPMLLFTGGRAIETGPSSGSMMAQLAVNLGVPPVAIITETRSLSTLQNALFSMPKMASARRIIIVTEGFHLPRSWLSFKWAMAQIGQNVDLALAHSTVFRKTGNWQSGPKLLAREALAFWFNLGRASLWQAVGLLNVADETRDIWLQ